MGLYDFSGKLSGNLVIVTSKRFRFIPISRGEKMEEKLMERIEVNPDVMLGKPVIAGTRLTLEIILEKLAYGQTETDIIEDYPFLEFADIKAALLFAAKQVSLEEDYVV